MKKTYEIDGSKFQDLQEFFETISHVITSDTITVTNLDGLNDIFRGGFGTPEDGFILSWKNSALSKKNLGYAETVQWLQKKLETCHETNRPHVKDELVNAEGGTGPTLFDIIIEIIQDHSPNGPQTNDQVELILA